MARKIPNWIDPLERKDNRAVPKFSVFDIESNNWKDFVVCGYYDGQDYVDYGSIKEFMDDVTKVRDDHRTIFAHNGGGFDFNFVLEFIVREGGRSDYRIDNIFSRGATFLSIEVLNKNTGATIVFRDSLAFLPFSLKSLTKNFKTECAKGEWDHSLQKDRNDPKLLEYLKADCVGLYQVLDTYFHWPLIRESGVAYTIASQALKVFRTTIDERIYGCSKTVDEFVRKGYFGGRTEVFRPYYKSKSPAEKLSCFDINSLYPSVMRDFQYPNKFIGWSTDYDPKSFGFWEATVHVPEDMYVPPLGCLLSIDPLTKEVEHVDDSSMGKFMFPVGTFSGVWSTIEIEYAKSVGVEIISTGAGAVFENGGYIFRNFIDELYELRMQAEKDSVDSFISKLLMNSCYGRFGLNLNRETIVQDDGMLAMSDVTPYEFETGEFIDGMPVIHRFVKMETRIDSFTNVAIAAWVTAHARIRMHRHYMKFQDRLFYSDTDSVMIRDDGKTESSKKLGEFKYEYSASEACFLLPKAYCLAGITGLFDTKGKIKETKEVIKGINSEAIKMRAPTIQDFVSLLEGDMKRAEKIPIPMEFIIKEKISKVKTAMRHGTFLHVTGQETKKFQAKYDKREIFVDKNGDYDTRPICIKDGKALNYRDPIIKVKAKKGKKKVTIDFGAEDEDATKDVGRSRKSKATV